MLKPAILYHIFDGLRYQRNRKEGRVYVHDKERLIISTVGEDVLVPSSVPSYFRRGEMASGN